jgi:radical SAM protein with 4Fe4S-binding SPASM domain
VAILDSIERAAQDSTVALVTYERARRFASSYAEKALRWSGLAMKPKIPLFERVVIELHSHCNRECFFCSRESDTAGKRKTANGQSVRQSMPTEKIMALFDELQSLRFQGFITFHQLSEAFLDSRLLPMAREAKRRGMRPYVHTNGDVLRNDERLCAETVEVFEYVVVGLYDYTSEAEREAEKAFWNARLKGTRVLFRLLEDVNARTHSADNDRMNAISRRSYPTAVCGEPQTYLLIHYNGDVSCCCEDMYGELLKTNIFETSIREIWYSERHAEIVTALDRGERTKFDVCAKCTRPPNRYCHDAMLDAPRLET